jgi:hypothetical protein
MYHLYGYMAREAAGAYAMVQVTPYRTRPKRPRAAQFTCEMRHAAEFGTKTAEARGYSHESGIKRRVRQQTTESAGGSSSTRTPRALGARGRVRPPAQAGTLGEIPKSSHYYHRVKGWVALVSGAITTS